MSIFVTVPDFPNVPDLPGVPALLRSATAQVSAAVNGLLINAGAGALQLGLGQPLWGIFDDSGAPVAIADTVRAVQYREEARISDAPVEDGSFSSFNKVDLPYASVVSMSCGGDAGRRAQFLAAIADAKESLDLFTIVLPETVYPNANIVAYDYRREQRNGATILHVDVHIEEVRVSVEAQFANVQNPASADPASQGQVQTSTPSAGLATLYGPLSAVQ